VKIPASRGREGALVYADPGEHQHELAGLAPKAN
jgi:hypothetical protein